VLERANVDSRNLIHSTLKVWKPFCARVWSTVAIAMVELL